MNRFILLVSSILFLVFLACNKIEPKQFNDNACESIGPVYDTMTIDSNLYFMTATINTNTEIRLRLKGIDTNTIASDSFQSIWVQLNSSNECYQAKSFKSNTEKGEVYFIIDYVVPTFIQPGYPAVWKFNYKGRELYLRTILK